MDEREKPLDDALGKLYRGLPRVDPPPAIDAAVLAAARRSVAAHPRRNWAVPVSLAAVLVLSVVVTLRVAEEEPEAQRIQVSPPPPSSSAAAKPVVPSADVPAPGPAAQAKPPSRPANVQRERTEKPKAPAEERVAMAPPRAFVPSPQADSAQPQAPAAAAGASSALPERSAARADRAPMSAKSVAKSAAAEASLASEAQSPQAWLERIVQLRAQARHAEADESHAEFRRRFPGYTIPPEVLQKIAPPR